MTGLKSGIFHTPFRTPFASRLIHICVDLQEIRTSDAHPQIPQEPCGRKDTEAFAHLRGQPQNPQEGRAACTKPKENQAPRPSAVGLFPWGPGLVGGHGRLRLHPGSAAGAPAGQSTSRSRSTMVDLETERYTARGTSTPSRANTGTTIKNGVRVRR